MTDGENQSERGWSLICDETNNEFEAELLGVIYVDLTFEGFLGTHRLTLEKTDREWPYESFRERMFGVAEEVLSRYSCEELMEMVLSLDTKAYKYSG